MVSKRSVFLRYCFFSIYEVMFVVFFFILVIVCVGLIVIFWLVINDLERGKSYGFDF